MRESLLLSLQIVRRNWKVYRKDFVANISPTVSDPIFYLIFIGLGLGSLVSDIDGRKYIDFLGPALVVSTALFTAFFETSYGFYVRMTFEDIFKAMLTTPIGVNEIVIGEFLWVGLKGALMVLGVTLVLGVLGVSYNVSLLPLLLLVGILVALPCGAMGLLASTMVQNINQFQTVYSFIISPLFFMSGVFFPVEKMPVAVQWVAYALPLVHGVEMARAVFWNQNVVATFLIHGGVLVAYSIVLCSWAFFKVRRKLQS